MTKPRPWWSKSAWQALALASGLLCLPGAVPLAPAAGLDAPAEDVSAPDILPQEAHPASPPPVSRKTRRRRSASPPSDLGPADVIDDDGLGVQGHASFYSPVFSGRRTATGEVFNPRAFTAASNRYPPGTRLVVQRLDNDRCAIVKVNDRMAHRHGRRIIDVSRSVAEHLGMVKAGVVLVRVFPLASPAGQREASAYQRGLAEPAEG